jgi:hypothetical protein
MGMVSKNSWIFVFRNYHFILHLKIRFLQYVGTLLLCTVLVNLVL